MSYTAKQARRDSGADSIEKEMVDWREAIDAIKAAAAQGDISIEITNMTGRTWEGLLGLGYTLISHPHCTEVRWT